MCITSSSFQNKLESRYTCTISEEETLWTSVMVSPKSSEQQNSSRGKFVKPTPFPTKASGTAPSPKSKTTSLNLSTPTLSVSRVDIPFLPSTSSDGSKNLVVKKKKKDSSSIFCFVVLFYFCSISILLASIYILLFVLHFRRLTSDLEVFIRFFTKRIRLSASVGSERKKKKKKLMRLSFS